MGKSIKVNYKKTWAWGWGVFFLLIAALVLANQFGGFPELGIWSIIIAALAVGMFVQCIVSLTFGSLPIPIAALYYIFQVPLDFPYIIDFWPLVLVTLLATAGLHTLLPNRLFRNIKKKNIEIIYTGEDGVTGTRGFDDEGQIEEGGGDNNPRISVQFGSVSRYLHADSLETVELECRFGSLEVYFDHVQLCQDGAEAFLNCKFGAIEIYVPSNWRIIDNMNTSLGGIDINGRREVLDENAPTLKISGNVSLGGVDVHRINNE